MALGPSVRRGRGSADIELDSQQSHIVELCYFGGRFEK